MSMIDATKAVIFEYFLLLTTNFTGRLNAVPISIRPTRAGGRSLDVETQVTGEKCSIQVKRTSRLVNCTISYSRQYTAIWKKQKPTADNRALGASLVWTFICHL